MLKYKWLDYSDIIVINTENFDVQTVKRLYNIAGYDTFVAPYDGMLEDKPVKQYDIILRVRNDKSEYRYIVLRSEEFAEFVQTIIDEQNCNLLSEDLHKCIERDNMSCDNCKA